MTGSPMQAPPDRATFACPECRADLPLGTPACPRCGMRLTGPLAQRLWHVDQQVAGLSAEARRLRQLLLQPPGPEELAETAELFRSTPDRLPPDGSVPARAPRGLTGQQLLLGLAAFLLLSGSAVFLLVIWNVIGLLGQALVMVALTWLAAWGAVVATRRHLAATAETAAVIASGLVVLDLSAAHRLGLLGLDRLPGDAYWTVAGLCGAGVLLGFDRWVPPIRRAVVYRPVAVLLATVSLWAAFSAVTPDGPEGLQELVAPLAALGVFALSLVLARVATRLADLPGLVSVGAIVPWLSAGAALVVHLGIAFDIGYSQNPTTERLGAMAVLLVLPLVLLAAQQWRGLRAQAATRVALRLLGLVGLLAALGIPVFATTRLGVSLIAVGVGTGLLALALVGQDAPASRRWAQLTWGDLLTWTGRLAVAGLFYLLFLLLGGGHETGLDMQAWRAGAGPGPWWLPVLPAAAIAVPSAVSAVRRDSVLAATFAHVAVLAGVLLALRNADPIVWATVTLVAAVVSLAVAAVARVAAESGREVGMEVVALVAAVIHGSAALAAATTVSDFVLTAVLVGLGALLLAYAALPGRVPFAYPGVIALTAALWVQLAAREIGLIEAWTLPAAAMFAGIGAVQWARDRGAPTWLTMAPALGLGLFPSLVVGVGGDSLLRLTTVTLAAALILVVGVAQRWQAPVVLAAIALGVVAWTQGGPLVAYVPGWLLLVGSGALLLAVGITWERSITLGRRTWAWLGAMQ